ncbi:hypothetical protein Cgig2_021445 [Carnegiea gigantea]|uniref:Uncharacterized protein n=1 Tax=Carnegiea gigantea TaxID=171969 RepID=A0A9Q1QAI0_9CARY|nr:hypothetical protein Cgig2_021445 [Carnegiea gigantea]
MLCMLHSSFTIGVQTSSEQCVSNIVQKRTPCVLLNVRYPYLSLISTVSSGYHFQGTNKYHVFRKSDQENQTPHIIILSSIIDPTYRGLSSYISLLLVMHIHLTIRDASCICLGTFNIALFTASHVGYCPPMAILASIYKGLNEISHSHILVEMGGHFPTHFLYAWLAKKFDAYKLPGEASSSLGMVKFSGLG